MADRRLLIAVGQAAPSAEALPFGVLLIGLRETDRAGWQERGLLDALLQGVDVPITVFDVGAG